MYGFFNALVIYMVRVFMWANQLQGLWKGWALKIETFLRPGLAPIEASAIWAKIKSGS
jgi:hypothetical protein